MVGRTGQQGISDGGIHGVVDGSAGVGIADDAAHDEVKPSFAQTLVVGPVPRRIVREEDPRIRPGGGDESPGEVLSLLGTHVERNGPLALVEPCPVETVSLGGNRPPAIVEAAADGIETDDVGT